jgi:hypothetical protein
MKILCHFISCDLIFIANAETYTGEKVGIYQCRRCNEISRGSPKFLPKTPDISNTFVEENLNKGE